MPNEPKIENLSKGQRIPAKTMNSVIDASNKVNNNYISPQTNKLTIDNGTGQISLGADDRGGHPFKIAQVTGSKIAITLGDWNRDQTTVSLEAGGIASADDLNSDIVLVSIDDFTKAGDSDPPLEANIPYYVYLTLQANVSATTLYFDPVLIPGQLNVLVDSDSDTANARSPSFMQDSIDDGSLISPRDLWIKEKSVIGIVTLDTNGTDFFIKSIDQKINEDITDFTIVPDTSNKYSEKEYPYLKFGGNERATIEFNSSTAEVGDDGKGINHLGELQIRNVNNCAGKSTFSFPSFWSQTTNNSLQGPGGRTRWIAIDTQYFPDEEASHDIAKVRTLQIRIDENEDHRPCQEYAYDGQYNSFLTLSLYGVYRTPIDSYSMNYYESTDNNDDQTEGRLQWAGIDSHLITSQAGGPYQYSMELQWNRGVDGGGLGYKALQLYQFAIPRDKDLESEDRIVVRDATGGNRGHGGEQGASIKYCTASQVWKWAWGGGGGAGDVDDEIDDWWAANATHATLIDIEPGTYTSFDHPGHWQNMSSTAGQAGAASTTFAVNNGISIGDSDEDIAIDMDSGDLYHDGHVSLHWHNRTLVHSDVYKSLDWEEQILYVGPEFTTDGIALNWKNRQCHAQGSAASRFPVSLDWDSRELKDSVEALTVDWENRILDGGTWNIDGDLDIIGGTPLLAISSVQILTTQQAAVANASVTAAAVAGGDADSDGVARAEINKLVTDVTDVKDQLNDLLAKQRTHGIIAT